MTYRKVSLNMDETDFTAANSYRHPRQSLNKLFRKFTRKTSPKSIVRSWSHSKKTADETLDVLLPGITNITNTSQASGVAPPDLKKYIVKPLHKINPLIKLYWKRPSNSKLITFVSNPRKVRSTQTPCTPPKRTSWILSSQPCYARLRAHQFAAWNRPPTPSPLLPERQLPFSNPEQNWKLWKGVTLLAMATANGQRNGPTEDEAGISHHELSFDKGRGSNAVFNFLLYFLSFHSNCNCCGKTQCLLSQCWTDSQEIRKDSRRASVSK